MPAPLFLITVLLLLLLTHPTLSYTPNLTTKPPTTRRNLLQSTLPLITLPFLPSSSIASEPDVLRSRQLTQSLKYLKSQSQSVQAADYVTVKAAFRTPPLDVIRKNMRGSGLSPPSQKAYDTFITDIESLDNKLTRNIRYKESNAIVEDWRKACDDLEKFIEVEGLNGVTVEGTE
ncbi:hypothetical protein TrVE_jg5597 [Triparma verrucosa]|uniref:Uncharacterized protein n=1 Tax=Triparma verrucosa TaxID=1606542 RepID=A0A9W7EPB7_9STRA|nr:hypothetical protein TrVE_jg5597 [Triparma verrucosa]